MPQFNTYLDVIVDFGIGARNWRARSIPGSDRVQLTSHSGGEVELTLSLEEANAIAEAVSRVRAQVDSLKGPTPR